MVLKALTDGDNDRPQVSKQPLSVLLACPRCTSSPKHHYFRLVLCTSSPPGMSEPTLHL